MIWIHVVLLKPPRDPALSAQVSYSVLHGHEKAMCNSKSGHLPLSYHCVLTGHERILQEAIKYISLVVPKWSVFPKINLVTQLCTQDKLMYNYVHMLMYGLYITKKTLKLCLVYVILHMYIIICMYIHLIQGLQSIHWVAIM